jgi:hypothetical protein
LNGLLFTGGRTTLKILNEKTKEKEYTLYGLAANFLLDLAV